MYRSREDVLWIGTGFGGVDRLDLWQTQFKYYRRNPASANSFLGVPMRAVAQDSSGVIWLGAADSLTRFDRAHGSYKHYNPAPGPRPTSPPSAVDIMSIFPDEQGAIWFDGIDGVYRLDTRTEAFQRYRPAGLKADQPFVIWAMAEDQQRNLWVVAFDDDGLYRFDRDSRQFTVFRHDPGGRSRPGQARLRSVAVDRRGDVWVGGPGLLSRLDHASGKFHDYRHDPADPNSLPESEIQDIHEDRQGVLWLASSAGLTRFEPTAGAATVYTKSNRLPTNQIERILEDRAGNLWLSGAKGISRFTPQTNAVRNYDVTDGLQANAFTAAYASASGELLFAGANGLTAFSPEQLADRPYPPSLALTDLQLFNHPVPIGESSILQAPIWDTQAIALRYDQNILSFEFAALSFAAPEHNR
jgi:ligand-binding sensor domain-containing protein